MMRGLGWIPLALVAACNAGSRSDSGNLVRDSAGIQIVENRTPLLPIEQMWRVDPTPVVQVGGAEAPIEEQLHLVMGATQLSDGRIAIGDQASSSIRFFGTDGRHLKDVGRRGEGPGEFRQILGLAALPADSLFVVDIRRFHLFTGDGDMVNSHSPEETTGPFIWPVTFLADGSYVGYSWNGPVAQAGRDRWTDSVMIYRVVPRARQDTVSRMPFWEFAAGPTPRASQEVVFGPRLRLVGGIQKIIAGYADRYELRVLSLDGSVERLIRLDRPLRSVSEADRAEYLTRLTNAPGENGRPAPPDLQAWREELAAYRVFSATFPAYSMLLIDRDQNLWVMEYGTWEDAPDRWGPASLLTPPANTHWDVFRLDGRWLGTVTMPPRFLPLEIGADYVLGLARDEDDVEQVRKHALVKPTG